jgi:hypothetical protein
MGFFFYLTAFCLIGYRYFMRAGDIYMKEKGNIRELERRIKYLNSEIKKSGSVNIENYRLFLDNGQKEKDFCGYGPRIKRKFYWNNIYREESEKYLALFKDMKLNIAKGMFGIGFITIVYIILGVIF